MTNYVALELPFKERKVLLQVYLRDTMLLAPGASKSLAAIGKIVDRPKMILDPSKEKDREMKQNMDRVRRDNWPLFREYALNDAIICVDYLERVIDQCRKATGSEKVPVTLTSIGVDLLMKTWSETLNLEPLEVLGKETVKEERWSKSRGRFVERKRDVPLQECFWHLDFVTGTYHGGRNEQFWFGPCFEADWTDYDLSSAYPTAMALIGRPLWREFRFSSDLDDYTPTTLGFACVDFKFPETVRYPTLPIRTQNGLVFPLEGQSCCSAPELFLARQLGAELKIRHGLIIPTEGDIRIFGEFIKDCLEKRSQFPKNSIDNLFWKEISNSTYGKTAQGLREKRVYDMRDREMRPLPESRITNPFFASFITSFVRAVLGEIMNALPHEVMVFSCTTDGFLTDATEEQILSCEKGVLANLFAEGRKLLTGEPSLLEKKHAVRRPLGWRTRGQATLKPGPLKESDPAYHIVLARGGIPIEADIDEPKEQSDYICDRFFARTPDDTVVVESLTGIREMVEYDADLVGKELTKRLSMEFDWKRRPFVTGIDAETRHLIFSTTPWKSVSEFTQLREVWAQFQAKKPICLRTIDEFEAFGYFADSVLMLSQSVHRKYLPTEAPDVTRLRQALCAAWKHKEAGFGGTASIDDQGKQISARSFADILTSCGLRASRADVENGLKTVFRGKSCPPTVRAKACFAKMKSRFPDLKEDVIFADAVKFESVIPDPGRRCPFVWRTERISS